MNVAVPLLITVPVFVLGYLFYARRIDKLFNVDDANATPAVTCCDDRDFVPTRSFVLFGHHFASIAGGGPIIGPTLAMLYGYLPVWLWILLGAVFLGAVHDMTALFTAVREKGRSMAEVAGATLGRAGSLIFLGFTIMMLLMLTAVFLKLSAASLTSLVPVDALDLSGSTLPIRIIDDGGVQKYLIGGIASTSVIIITLFSPLLGYLLYRRKANAYAMAALSLAVATISLVIGMHYPVRMGMNTWMILLSIYTVFAAGIPVWLVLQPRDFTNSFLLYIGIFLLVLGALAAGFQGVTIGAPALNVAQGSAKIGPIFPLLFITVACGAISGFHSLVAGGTSCKQISRESDVRRIAYGGMLLEGLLALLVAIAVGAGLDFQHYVDVVFPAPGKGSNPILAFALGMGGLLNRGLGINHVLGAVFGILMVEGFVVTTLDTAVRLNRYLLEELWSLIFKKTPQVMKSYVFNAVLCVVLMFALAHTNTIMDLWKIFGSANQLLAALTLIAVAAWLALCSRNALFATIPAAFMMAVTRSALAYVLVTDYLPKGNWVLAAADLALLLMALSVLALAVKFIRRRKVATA